MHANQTLPSLNQYQAKGLGNTRKHQLLNIAIKKVSFLKQMLIRNLLNYFHGLKEWSVFIFDAPIWDGINLDKSYNELCFMQLLHILTKQCLPITQIYSFCQNSDFCNLQSSTQSATERGGSNCKVLAEKKDQTDPVCWHGFLCIRKYKGEQNYAAGIIKQSRVYSDDISVPTVQSHMDSSDCRHFLIQVIPIYMTYMDIPSVPLQK